MKLDAEDIEAIAQRVIQLQQNTLPTNEILTRAEARAYTKRRSEAAFCEWCHLWGVKPFQRGRYSRTQIDLALSREARKRAA